MDTDEEQVEKLKAWLKENGLSIVLGVVIGVGGLSGYRYWQHSQEVEAEEASQLYTQMLQALNSSDRGGVEEHAQLLISDYTDTEYAQLARLALAKSHVENDELDLAEETLQQIVGSSAQQPLAYLTRTRLAAVQMQSGQLDSALTTLSIEFPNEFTARVAELRGDILAQQGKISEAVEAYEIARWAEPGPANPEFLQQKLSDLGERGVKRHWRLVLLLPLVVMVACSGEVDNTEPPAPLTTIEKPLVLIINWKLDTRANANRAAYRLRPLIAGDHLYSIDTGGTISFIDPVKGHRLWHIESGLAAITGLGAKCKFNRCDIAGWTYQDLYSG